MNASLAISTIFVRTKMAFVQNSMRIYHWFWRFPGTHTLYIYFYIFLSVWDAKSEACRMCYRHKSLTCELVSAQRRVFFPRLSYLCLGVHKKKKNTHIVPNLYIFDICLTCSRMCLRKRSRCNPTAVSTSVYFHAIFLSSTVYSYCTRFDIFF